MLRFNIILPVLSTTHSSCHMDTVPLTLCSTFTQDGQYRKHYAPTSSFLSFPAQCGCLAFLPSLDINLHFQHCLLPGMVTWKM
ncbi:hypothetical protein XELAEV_18044271mg [Xenopus laevis]|uniref:Uncharacterized protein n=1 Tax=Xenopus laevis TaxID=8355 RepID=A0A974BYD8_XENLA|nr:hypothetical protein XELAEV_18044271mg [Xenopus laevis]